MATRSDILAGRAVVVVDIQDATDKGLRVLRSKLRVFSNSISEIGGDLFRGGLAGTFASIFPVKEFMNFQDQLLFLQTKLQVTDAAMKPLESRIRQLGMTTSFSSTEVAKAATAYAQAGFSLQETSDALQAALDLSRGGQVDLSTSTTILSNAIRTFGADANEASSYASKFIAAARKGTLDIVDIGQSLTYASGTFAQLNVNIDEVLGLITNLSTAGLKASLAGTSLNTAFLNLAGSAEKLKELLGITFEEADFETPLIALTKIEKALQKFPKLERIGIIQSLVNIRGGRAVFGEFLSGLGKLDEITKEIKNSTNEARLSAEKLDSRLGGVFRRAISAFQEFQLAVGATSEGPLTTFGDNFAAFFNNMSELSTKNPRFVQGLLLVGPASLAAGAGLLFMTTIMSKMAMLIGPLISLNAVIFKTMASIVGGNIKAGSGILGFARTLPKSLESISSFGSFDVFGKITAGALRFSSALDHLGSSAKVLAEESPVFEEIFNPKGYNPARAVGAALQGASAGNALTPKNFKLPLLTPSFKFALPVVNGPESLTNAALTNILGELDFAKIDTEVTAATKVGMKFKPLPEAIREAISVSTALIQNPNYMKGASVGDAISDAMTANSIPKSLEPKITEGVLAALNKTADSLPSAVKAAKVTETIADVLLSTDFRKPLAESLPFKNSLLGPAPPLFSDIGIPKGANGQPFGAFVSKEFKSFGGKGAFAARQVAIEQAQAARVVKQSPLKGAFVGLGKTIKNLDYSGTATRLITPLKSLGPFLSKIGSGFFSIGKSIASTNWLAKFISLSKSVGGIAKGLLRIASGFRTVLFSASGWLLIVEGLILFGDRIPGVAQLLNKLGTAFSNLFGNIGTTLSNTLPSLQKIGEGVKNIFTGDAERGLLNLEEGFRRLGTVLYEGLSEAWTKFKADLEPITSVVKQIGLSLAAGFELAINTLTATFGNIAGGFKIIIGGEGTFLELLQNAFSSQNIEAFFAVIGGFFVEMFKRINIAISAMLEVINLAKNGIMSMLEVLSLTGNKSAGQALDNADPRRVAARNKVIGLENNRDLELSNIDVENEGYQKYWDTQSKWNAKIAAAQAELDNLGPALGTFAFNLQATNEALDKGLNNFLASLSSAASQAQSLLQPPSPGEPGFIGPIKPKGLKEFIGKLPKAPPIGLSDTSEFEGPNNFLEEIRKEILGDEFNPLDWLREDFNKAFEAVRSPLPIQEEQIAKLAPAIGKALVGDFMSTRGNKLQGVNKAEKLAEKQVKVLERIEVNTDPRKQPTALFQ